MNTSQRLVIEVRSEPKKDASGFDFAPLIPPLVAGLIVAAGWRVVEHYASKRERRADLRESLKVLEGAITSIVAVATKFYQISGRNSQGPALATLIKAKIQSLTQLIGLIAESGVEFDATEEMKLFRQAVTGGTFESATRAVLKENDSKFLMMDAAGQNLVQTVRLATYRALVSRPKKLK